VQHTGRIWDESQKSRTEGEVTGPGHLKPSGRPSHPPRCLGASVVEAGSYQANSSSLHAERYYRTILPCIKTVFTLLPLSELGWLAA
jgi:hypothetical protein